MTASEYPDPVEMTRDEATSVLDEATLYGVILPARLREISVTLDTRCEIGSLLPAEDSTRSGPFYRLAGIVGHDPGTLVPGRRYVLTVCLVYRREYFGFIGDYYVYVAAVR